MTEAHDKYIRGILNDEIANEEQKNPSIGKKFWQYIKSRKKDTVNKSKNSSGTKVKGSLLYSMNSTIVYLQMTI